MMDLNKIIISKQKLLPARTSKPIVSYLTDQQGTALNWQLSTDHNVPTVALIFKASLLDLLYNWKQTCKIYLDLTNLMPWYNSKNHFIKVAVV